jgi:uncharacterized membrane protein
MDTIYGIFNNMDSADRALTKFAALNYSPQEVSVIVNEDIVKESKSKEVVKGAGTGVVAGGIVGGVAGLLLGISAITVAGLSPLIIAGPLAVALGITAGAAATIEGAAVGALGGGLLGALVGLGIPRETAEIYETKIKEGKVLLGVPIKTGIDMEIVRKVFEDEHAEEIYTTHE